LVEFDPQIDSLDYTSPFSFHLAKMSLHFASASLMASLGLRSWGKSPGENSPGICEKAGGAGFGDPYRKKSASEPS